MIYLRTLGEPAVLNEDGSRLDDLVRQTKRFSLLLYLVCDERQRPHRRDELLAMFWPEGDVNRGRNALRQTLHSLRTTLGSHVIPGNGSEEIWIPQDQISSDVRTFSAAMEENAPETALALYRGDFLSGFFLSDSPGFEDWVENRRRELHELAFRAAEDLAFRAEDARDLSDALHWWRRALDLHPFDEILIRRLMVLLAGSGNRGQAMAEFLSFRRSVQRELDAAVSKETLELAKRISEGAQAFHLEWLRDRRRNHHRTAPPHQRRSSDRAEYL